MRQRSRQTRSPAIRRRRRSSAGSQQRGTLTSAIADKLRFLLNPRILLALIALWVVYEGLLSQHSVVNLYKFRQERDQLKQELAAAEAKRDSLKTQLELLESDEFTIEKLAREKLGLAREGEIIYRYDDPVPERVEEAPLTPPIVDEGEEEAERPPDSERR